MSYQCPKCKHEFYDRLKFCPECGFDFTVGQRRCPKCRNQVPKDSKTCPECGLDFERWAFLVPRIIVFGSLGLLLIIAIVFPWIWKVAPWLHDKGTTIEGKLISEVGSQAMVPLFINWRTGERYIVVSAEQSGYPGGTAYMNNLIPLPPEVVFHYDMPLGEKVWIIRRAHGTDGNDWIQVGRWMTHGKPDKYGWVHATNIRAEE